MASAEYVKKIAIVGGTGLVGGEIFRSILDTGKFNITAITREQSSATFPSGVNVQKGDYSSNDFLESALTGQDVLIITLSAMTPPDVQTNLIRAATKVGVPWILPNDYGGDGDNEEMRQAVFILASKKKYHDQIAQSGVSSWIGIASNLWIDFGLKGGWFSVDIANRKATLYDGGTTPVITASVPQVGRAVAKLLQLPVNPTSSSPACLSDYKNKFVYVSSFSVSQTDMLASAQRVTKTKPQDWTVSEKSLDEYIKAGPEMLKQGNRMGMMNIMYGSTFKKGLGDQFHGRELANQKLGLEEEQLDDVMEKVVRELEEGKK